MSEKQNRPKLRVLIAQYNVDNQDVATLLNRSVHTVNSWTSESNEADIPDHSLELLEIKLKQRNQG